MPFFLFCLLPLSSPSEAAGRQDFDRQIAIEEQRRKALDRQIEGYRSSIRKMDQKVDSLLIRIDELQQNEAIARQEIEILELQNLKLQEDLIFLSMEARNTQEVVNELQARLKQRMIDLYKYGSSEELNLFFSSRSVFEAVESVYLLKKLDRYDELVLSQLLDKQQEMKLSEKVISEHRERLKNKAASLRKQKELYNTSIRQTNAFVGEIQRKKALAQKAAREMEEAQKAVGQTILALMRRKKERDAEEARKGRARRGEVDYLAGRGQGSMFDWPVRGPITSGYGMRIHPIFKTKAFHSGIDIAAPQGTPVKAAAAGEVLFTGWLRGYGQVVILEHGKNYSTVYAHLSSINAREGQVLKSGAVLGGVGRTGTATGHHLHFEVRVGSKVQNPLNYLKR
ncbi:MAG: peptidoglycan DD-metalloendopeptidase family protein [Fretibacterium sp.]|nr:peptidoglycan DD-metalloendopeptidase family protein [Fretibacterium sp.]